MGDDSRRYRGAANRTQARCGQRGRPALAAGSDCRQTVARTTGSARRRCLGRGGRRHGGRSQSRPRSRRGDADGCRDARDAAAQASAARGGARGYRGRAQGGGSSARVPARRQGQHRRVCSTCPHGRQGQGGAGRAGRGQSRPGGPCCQARPVLLDDDAGCGSAHGGGGAAHGHTGECEPARRSSEQQQFTAQACGNQPARARPADARHRGRERALPCAVRGMSG